MYISKIEIIDIRCFEKVEFDFENEGSSILISGDNGDGKSCILRSIAIGLCDESSAAALLRELPGRFVRKGKPHGTITIHLIDNGIRYEILTKIISLAIFERIIQHIYKHGSGEKNEINQEQFPWKNLFVSGYGAGIRTHGTADYQQYKIVDSVYTLFQYETPLQNPELGFRRILDEVRKKSSDPKEGQIYYDEMYTHITTLLEYILDLGAKSKLHLTSSGIEVENPSWGKIEIGSLGDGHRSTITWILDLISWWVLYLQNHSERDIWDNREISGIVIIDEIEQHLHPKWQIKIMRLLRDRFKNVQFIVSTHSPLILSGAEEITVHAFKNGKKILQNVMGWLAEDVYREVMDLGTTRSDKFTRMINELEKKHSKVIKGTATPKEKSEVEDLKKYLKQRLPTSDPVTITARMNSLIKEIESKKRKKTK